MNTNRSASKSVWDAVGIGLSGLCMVHCLLTPVVLTLAHLWPGADAAHDWVHPLLAVLLIPVTAQALRTGRCRHGHRGVRGYLLVGCLLVLAATLGHDLLGSHGEAGVMLLGSSLLVAGHWCNSRTLAGEEGSCDQGCAAVTDARA